MSDLRAYIEGEGFTISAPFKQDQLSQAKEWLYKTMRVNGALYGSIYNDNEKLHEWGIKWN